MNGNLVIIVFATVISLSKCQECETGYFQCNNGKCVPGSYICDIVDDCGDGSDETYPCPACPSPYFQCNTGECIPASWICDEMNDCRDGSDEQNSETGLCPTCPDTHFQCGTGRCVSPSKNCDKNNDCEDWSDESEDLCPCSDGELRCVINQETAAGYCMPTEWICDVDGIWDCPNGSDETNCTQSTI